MNKNNFYTSLLILAILSFIGCNNGAKEHQNPNNQNGLIEIVDDLNVNHKFSSIPSTIITLAPNLTEFIYKLDLQDRLIGNTNYCNYPEEAKNVEKVGDLLTVNYEKIVQLQPDIIFVTIEGNIKGTYQKLVDLGFEVVVTNPRNYEGIVKSFKTIAKIFNVSTHANKIIENWDKRLDSAKNIGLKKSKAMFLVSLNPLMLAGRSTFINAILEKSNFENIVSDSKVAYPIYSRETILELNPEYIITSKGNGNIKESLVKIYPEWKNLSAIINNKIIEVNPDVFYRPGPRFIEAVEFLSNQFRLHHQK